MVLEEIPSPIALLFAGFILGSCYLALMSLFKEGFSEVQSFDKLMLSLTFGMLAFVITISMFKVNVNFSDMDSVSLFLSGSPMIFLINIFIARVLMQMWNYIQNNLFKGA